MAKVVALVHPHETIQVSHQLLVQKCDLFADNPILTISPYTLKSQVSLADVRAYVSSLEGQMAKVETNNFRGLSQLCDEFRFRELGAHLSPFGNSDDSKEQVTVQD
jgi:hypothetical protein